MTNRLLIFLVILYPISDLGGALIYSITGVSSISDLRNLRDLVTISLFFIALYRKRVPVDIYPPAVTYSFFVLIYTIVSLIKGISISLVISSAAILLLPILIFIASSSATRPSSIIDRVLCILFCYSFVSIAFGLWEKENTYFWQYTVFYGDYLRDVKGVFSGFNSAFDLPWNFFGYELERRAAGLLASPLANGFFLGTVSMLLLSKYSNTHGIGYLLLFVFSLFGVYLTGTRGALPFVIISIIAYALLNTYDVRKFFRIILISSGVFVFTLPFLQEIVFYTVNFLDGSTIGHYRAIVDNFSGLLDISLFGYGVGSAGARASAVGNEIMGGGEGAIFSIAYQLGMPGAIAFLWFYVVLVRLLLKNIEDCGTYKQQNFASVSVLIGASSSLFLSEHLLTYSGAATIWLVTSLCIVNCRSFRKYSHVPSGETGSGKLIGQASSYG